VGRTHRMGPAYIASRAPWSPRVDRSVAASPDSFPTRRLAYPHLCAARNLPRSDLSHLGGQSFLPPHPARRHTLALWPFSNNRKRLTKRRSEHARASRRLLPPPTCRPRCRCRAASAVAELGGVGFL